ncbi:MAG: multifunctional CCA addition/repair protein [Burkholderiaceae bacterium]|nr:multifunctional CCA addition/repair protein [Burkholderiaceae bacterium]
MGVVNSDRDWVVVGATPEQMDALGFVAVGADFPVFLHPRTKEEYALARTERKTAKGYHGFSFYAAPDVTLTQDLARRDLTINAMAVAHPAPLEVIAAGDDSDWTPDFSQLIDPFNGATDVAQRRLRHVADAFAEDPVRILRLARFHARWPNFEVAPETLTLMRHMVRSGEVDALVAERIWQEITNGLMATQPSQMFLTLRACGALTHLLPELDALWGVPQRADYHPEVDTGVHAMMVLDTSARLQCDLPTRFAALCHDFGKGNTPADVLPRHTGHELRSVQLLNDVCVRWRVPRAMRELAEVVAREHGHIHRCQSLSPDATLRLLDRCDAFRRPDRFKQILLACESDARGRLGLEEVPYVQATWLWQVFYQAAAVATSDIAQAAMRAPEFQAQKGEWIASQIHAARVAAITPLFNQM